MFNDEDYKLLARNESIGTYGTIGVMMLVAGTPTPDFRRRELSNAIANAVDSVVSEIGAAVIADDEKAQDARRSQREQLLGLFEQPIYVEEIPNGYCSSWCCRHLPWFVVTTRIGRITIGWRKRVISIDWEGSLAKELAEALFPNESVTKACRLIHAWSLEDAARYIATVVGSVEADSR